MNVWIVRGAAALPAKQATKLIENATYVARLNHVESNQQQKRPSIN
jgi:hypothetical protein